MLLSLFALITASPAAEIEVVLNVPISVFVDGAPMYADETGTMGVARDLAAGTHVIETRNLMGKTTAYKKIELAVDDRIRFEYRNKELWHINTMKMAMPTASTTVTQTTTTTTGPVGAGYDVYITEGGQTLHVGSSVGPNGAGVVVTDGMGSVSMNAGVQVTETMTTTTTVTTTSGDAFGTVVVAPAGMDPASFQSLHRQMGAAAFSDDKLSLLTTAVRHNGLTCEQLGQLLDTISMGSDKVEAVRIARPSVVDPQNAHVLNSRFSFSSDAQQAQAFFR